MCTYKYKYYFGPTVIFCDSFGPTVIFVTEFQKRFTANMFFYMFTGFPRKHFLIYCFCIFVFRQDVGYRDSARPLLCSA